MKNSWKLLLGTLTFCLLLLSGIYLRLYLEHRIDTVETAETFGLDESEEKFSIHFFDVGEGDSALVECHGKRMLIDGGSPAYSSFLYSYLKQHGITYLDVVVNTHGHEDHVGGLACALNYAKVGIVYGTEEALDNRAFESFSKYVRQQGNLIQIPHPGDSFMLGDAEITFLGPVDHNLAKENENNASLVLRIVYGQTSFLFTGDAEKEEEESILEKGGILPCTVLKVAHHGSYTSSSEEFLKTANPKICIISVGGDNLHNHPHDSVLRRIRKIGSEIYRTDLCGEIVCISNGKDVYIQTEKPISGQEKGE